MEKEFEALESLISKTGCMNDTCAHLHNCLKDNKCRYDVDNSMCQDYEMAKTLKNALTELKAIKESKPSEAMESLEKLRQECVSTYFDEHNKQMWTTDKTKDYRCNTIKQALLKAQEQEKALEIIKAKDVDMYSLRRCGPVEEYNTHFAIDEYQKLKQEEYDTLKEWLESDKTK